MPRSRIDLELDGTSVYLIEKTIGDCDILRGTAAKTEDGPACTERAIRNSYKFAASKQCASVILRLYGAIGDGDIFRADEMKSVIVAVDAVMDIDVIHMDAGALNDTNAVKRTIEQRDIADGQVLATIAKDVIWPAATADAAGWRSTANSGVELRALPIDRAGPFNCYFFCIDCEEKGPVTVLQGSIAV